MLDGLLKLLGGAINHEVQGIKSLGQSGPPVKPSLGLRNDSLQTLLHPRPDFQYTTPDTQLNDLHSPKNQGLDTNGLSFNNGPVGYTPPARIPTVPNLGIPPVQLYSLYNHGAFSGLGNPQTGQVLPYNPMGDMQLFDNTGFSAPRQLPVQHFKNSGPRQPLTFGA